MICEEELKKSNCSLIHFGACLVKNGRVIGRGHNYSLRGIECIDSCVKDKIKNRAIGKNPALCYAVHAEWMALIDAINKHGIDEVYDSTLFIVGRYPDGTLFDSKFFACTICSRLLKFCKISRIINPVLCNWMPMEDAFQSSIDHILGVESNLKRKLHG